MKIEKSSSNYLILDSGTAMTFDNQATLQLKLTYCATSNRLCENL